MDLISNVIAVRGEVGYASDSEKNGLFKVNMETGECRYIKSFPNERILFAGLHGFAEWVGEKIFFIPQAGRHISVVHSDTLEIDTIEIPQIIRKDISYYSPKFKFTRLIQYNGFLWLIPATYPGILKINPNTYETKIIDNWLPTDGYFFRRAVCLKANMLYVASGNNNNVLLLDLDSEKGEIKRIGELNNGMMDMCEFGEDFVMAPRKNGAVVRWNPMTNEIHEYNKYPEEFESGNIVFIYSYQYDNQIILVPDHANTGIRLSENGLWTEKELIWKRVQENSVSIIAESESRIYCREYGGGATKRCYFVDKSTNVLTAYQLFICNPEERLKGIAESVARSDEIVIEKSTYNLRDWIKSNS